jgi:hypothetical protein
VRIAATQIHIAAPQLRPLVVEEPHGCPFHIERARYFFRGLAQLRLKILGRCGDEPQEGILEAQQLLIPGACTLLRLLMLRLFLAHPGEECVKLGRSLSHPLIRLARCRMTARCRWRSPIRHRLRQLGRCALAKMPQEMPALGRELPRLPIRDAKKRTSMAIAPAARHRHKEADALRLKEAGDARRQRSLACVLDHQLALSAREICRQVRVEPRRVRRSEYSTDSPVLVGSYREPG